MIEGTALIVPSIVDGIWPTVRNCPASFPTTIPAFPIIRRKSRIRILCWTEILPRDRLDHRDRIVGGRWRHWVEVKYRDSQVCGEGNYKPELALTRNGKVWMLSIITTSKYFRSSLPKWSLFENEVDGARTWYFDPSVMLPLNWSGSWNLTN